MDHSSYAMAASLLGFSYEFLGETQLAQANYYTRGLAAQPQNDGLLVARGILLYGSSPRAITDLELAVRQGSPVIWPYLPVRPISLAKVMAAPGAAACYPNERWKCLARRR